MIPNEVTTSESTLPLLDHGADMTGHHIVFPHFGPREYVVEKKNYLGDWTVKANYINHVGIPVTGRTSMSPHVLPRDHGHFARVLSTRLTLLANP